MDLHHEMTPSNKKELKRLDQPMTHFFHNGSHHIPKKCLRTTKAKYALVEVYVGSCEQHLKGRDLANEVPGSSSGLLHQVETLAKITGKNVDTFVHMQVICRFDIQDVIMTNNNTKFIDLHFQELLDRLNINKDWKQQREVGKNNFFMFYEHITQRHIPLRENLPCFQGEGCYLGGDRRTFMVNHQHESRYNDEPIKEKLDLVEKQRYITAIRELTLKSIDTYQLKALLRMLISRTCPTRAIAFDHVTCLFQKWGVDILGPFPIIKYLIVAVDYFPKWVEAEPVTTISTERIKHFHWKRMICHFRLPVMIISDNGTQFPSRSVTKFCSQLKIQQSFTLVEHPQSNGQVEAANKIILRGLRRRLEEAKERWVEELPQVLWSYHTTPHSITNETPFRLTFGTEAMIDNLRISQYGL
ncbi:Tf2-9, partial [Mucuna pruriens]